jgi:hypothetical protein
MSPNLVFTAFSITSLRLARRFRREIEGAVKCDPAASLDFSEKMRFFDANTYRWAFLPFNNKHLIDEHGCVI